MRRIVTTIMFLACLLYGFMPVAACPMVAPAASDLSMDHGMHLRKTSAKTIEAASHDHARNSGNQQAASHVPFCAACLVIPPTVLIDGGKPFAFGYPLPDRDAPLIAAVITPILPPPRARL